MKFILDSDELSTPEGLQNACRRAREYVEKHIPGKHQPSPGRWFVKEGDEAVGCACAMGYLGAALYGDMLVALRENPVLPLTLRDFGLPESWYASAFEYGFDRGFYASPEATVDSLGEPWILAGLELGREWREDMERK